MKTLRPATRRPEPRQTRRTLRTLIANAYPAPQAPNRHYSNHDFIELAALATGRRSSLHDASTNNPRLPDSDTLHAHLHPIDPTTVYASFQTTHQRLLDTGRALGYFDQPTRIAIDRHNEDYYGADAPWIVSKRDDHGTNKAHAYLTSQRMQDPCVTLDLELLSAFRDQHDALRELVHATMQRARVSTAFLDKAFYTQRDLSILLETPWDFVVAVPLDKHKKAIAKEAYAGRVRTGPGTYVATRRYRVGDARRGPEVVLVFCWEPDAGEPSGERLFVYACRREVDAKTLWAWSQEYSSRWSIETGYRIVEHTRLRSTTHVYANRLFLTCIVFLLDTFWRLVRHARRVRAPSEPVLSMPTFRGVLVDACGATPA